MKAPGVPQTQHARLADAYRAGRFFALFDFGDTFSKATICAVRIFSRGTLESTGYFAPQGRCMTENGKRGGYREGAGRPAPVELFSTRFRLSAIDIAIAEQLGAGNRTEGVRRALSFANEFQAQLREWEQNTERETSE